MNVTTLGSGDRGASRSVTNIVNYLEGKSPGTDRQLDRAGSAAMELDQHDAGPGRYYADSGAGRWIGNGTEGAGFALSGEVEREQFSNLLLGADPHTGEQLMHSRGVSGRANQPDDAFLGASITPSEPKGASHNPWSEPKGALLDRPEHPKGAFPGAFKQPDNMISSAQVAQQSGVDDSYLRRVIRSTNQAVAAQDRARAEGLPVPDLPATHLHATKHGKTWFIDQHEAERFAQARKPQQVIHGYDLTFSVPKSVSVLWAASEPEVQRVIENTLTRSVQTGMAYIEDEGFWVRSGRNSETAGGMTAAAYRHDTSRALEPQLHDHVVVANMAINPDGEVRAVDARGLMAHATTAGHLSAATLRRGLSEQLGVEWTPVHKGIAEIEGIPAAAMKAMSSRREAVIDLAEEVGAFTTQGRQTAALMTRPNKDTGVDQEALRQGWRTTLAEHGLTRERATELTPALGQGLQPVGLTKNEEAELLAVMSSRDGVTQFEALFDRRNVVAFVADHAGNRIEANEIQRIADRWLAERAVPLELSNTWETIGHKGRVSLSHDTVYSTPEMIKAEQHVIERHRAGLDRGNTSVPPNKVEAAIRRLEHSLGGELGPDQAAAVRAITQHGHQFQAVQGLAGSGKTTAMAAAVDAWQSNGNQVVGLAPFGTAARKLGNEIGIETRTVESLIVKLNNLGPERVLDPNTVVLLDEASTISTYQLSALYHAANATGASVVSIGDPQQHSSVEAGGLWKALVDIHHDTTPVLDINRRQNPETLQAVREALEIYRSGDVGGSLDMLESDGRIVTADSWPELLDRLADDWLPHHLTAIGEGRAPTQMIAERNRDRQELNTRAQARLKDTGHLGPGFEIGDSTFHIGDRVVAQKLDYAITREGGSKNEHLLNGSTGIVVAFDGTERAPDLIVDFNDIGTVTVPHDFAAHPIGPGRGGGLTPAYAVTSYKAEGQTYDASLGLAAPGAVNKEGMYVSLTRGSDDLAIYSIDPNQTPERVETEIPGPADPRTMTAALRDSLERTQRPAVASVADTGIAAALDTLTPTPRSEMIEQARIAGNAITQPDATQIAVFGPRPERAGPHQHAWDQAVATQAIYQARYPTSGRDITSIPKPLTAPALNPAHESDHATMQHSTTQARRAAAGSMPLDELLAERDLYKGGGGELILNKLENAVTQAGHEVTSAQNSVDRVAPFADAKQLRRPPTAGAEQRLEKATQRLDVAQANLTIARSDLDNYRQSEQPTAARSQLIDDALTWRVNNATKQPARYLTNALGPRPAHGKGALEWNRAAHLVERVRHNHGLTPNHGPQPGATPIQRAVGTANAGWKPLTVALRQLSTAISHDNTRSQGLQR